MIGIMLVSIMAAIGFAVVAHACYESIKNAKWIDEERE